MCVKNEHYCSIIFSTAVATGLLMVLLYQRNSSKSLVVYTDSHGTMSSSTITSLIPSTNDMHKSTMLLSPVTSHETTPSTAQQPTTVAAARLAEVEENSIDDQVFTEDDNITLPTLKSLYESDMIVSQGVKTEWIRNRMKA